MPTGTILMRKARDLAIRTRLESTKTYGLVEDYQIDWRDSPLSPPQVTVRGRHALPTQITRNYVTVLLGGFVPARAITVT